MQLMSWPLSRLGTRFSLFFEPYRRRVMHSALGRFLDRPLDLAVGLVEPDGTERHLPFTAEGRLFDRCEQFERANSITFRGRSRSAGLRFELNFHSPFYPQDEPLCLLPAFYVELRVTWSGDVPAERVPRRVRLFFRLQRPETAIEARDGHVELDYTVPLPPRTEGPPPEATAATARVRERIQSLNANASPTEETRGGKGLTLDLPVTADGSGVKWRLVWAAHTGDPVLATPSGEPISLRASRHWPTLDAVLHDAIEHRDKHLLRSRHFEKALEQAPLSRSRWHMFVFGFQNYLTTTFWGDGASGPWFSSWDGENLRHSTIEAEYRSAPFYLAFWPGLLRHLLGEWMARGREHAASGGTVPAPSLGRDLTAGEPTAAATEGRLDDAANVLLLLQSYVHWTGDVTAVEAHGGAVRGLAAYLTGADADGDGFPSEQSVGMSWLGPARKWTRPAIKRVMAMKAAADLLRRVSGDDEAARLEQAADACIPRIEEEAWRTDHLGLWAADPLTGVVEVDALASERVDAGEGGDAYSIETADGLLLPLMAGRPMPFDRQRLRTDVMSATRETLTHYGCAPTSHGGVEVSISTNVWRDLAASYLHAPLPRLDGHYWDLQVASNTGWQSHGFQDVDTGRPTHGGSRGAATVGYFVAGPRLRIDRLDGDGVRVDPARHRPQRWPLLAVADWDAGRIPVCVVDEAGAVNIEGSVGAVHVDGDRPAEP